jgi:predicted nuclease with TOPRIM domain
METYQLHTEIIKRVEKCETDIRELQNKDNKLTIQQAQVDIKLDYIKSAIEKLGVEVSKIAEQPAKRWDTLINAAIAGAISLILSGSITFALTKH